MNERFCLANPYNEHLLRTMLEMGTKVQHRTIWARGSSSEEGQKVFIFMTFDGECAERAKKLLGEGDCLCDLKIGVWNPSQVPVKRGFWIWIRQLFGRIFTHVRGFI